MFTEQLAWLPRIKSQKLTSLKQPHHNQVNPEALQFQYEICNIFMKQTGEKLQKKQNEIIFENTKLIQCLLEGKLQEKQKCSTNDTTRQEAASIHTELQDQKSNILNRKNAVGITAKRIETNLGESLKEIEECCSISCLTNISNLATEYRKLLNKIKYMEARENLVTRRQDQQIKNNEDNVMLKRKMENLTLKIEELSTENSLLREKNNSILQFTNKKISQISLNQKYIEINNKVFKDIKNYLGDKENSANNKISKVEEIQGSILKMIQSVVIPDGCKKCCELMKRLKDSIFKYKRFLQIESQQIEKLYSKYKKTIFTHRLKTQF